ncbi:hypothetical protein [Desulfocurvus sp.]|jgi:hypothetical protein|uniref:hypothetical protein n=1 Tax=Desulfocurvus sp. TaxID=2871698 RepID=UPI0025C552D1|nr:hypothetical protein [Desulfocurvus sp.]MCK9240512.1 hypothetical protein [Desulfocurvus sp.]
MPLYYVNRNARPDGDHEVHDEHCPYRPEPAEGVLLGWHPSCHGAVLKAREHFARVDGCHHCCPDCQRR